MRVLKIRRKVLKTKDIFTNNKKNKIEGNKETNY